MSTSIVLTVIGKDHPGIVESLSAAVAAHDGNWTQSSMSSLAGQFAGILLATVPDEHVQACIRDIEALASEGLRVVAQAATPGAAPVEFREYELDLVGHDRRGIVRDITQVLTRHGVNVQELETEVASASMAGGALFKAKIRILVPPGTSLAQIEMGLEDIANELMVEIRPGR